MAPISRDKLRRIAEIVGPASSAAKALAEIERREASGEVVGAYLTGRVLVIGPPLPTPQPSTQQEG